MALTDRLHSLQSKHEKLEFQLQAERNRPLPSPDILTQIKKEKLLLKDAMEKLTEAYDAITAQAESDPLLAGQMH